MARTILNKSYMNKDNIRLIKGDCIEVMQQLIKDGIKVDLTVTSPPYDNLRTYNGTCEWNFDIFKEVAQCLYDITIDGGVVVWVVGDATIKGSETGTSFRQALYFKEIGFNLETMIWEKNGAGCLGTKLFYLQNFEYMFILTKGKPKTVNFLKDRKNKVCNKNKVKLQGTKIDGVSNQKRVINLSEYGKRFNIWKISPSHIKGHPATFPEQLANDHIISWSNEGDLVLDPFMGSGTTGKMCLLNNRKFIGIEKVEEYFKIAEQRIESTLNKGE